MSEYQLDSFIQLHEGTATVTDTALSAADVLTLREARRKGAFVQARTNMSVGYAVLGVASAQQTQDANGQEGLTFSLIYSGEAVDALVG